MESILSPATVAKLRQLEADFNAMSPAEQAEFTAGMDNIYRLAMSRRKGRLDELDPHAVRTCPRCAESKTILEFKRRSFAQGYAPTWCKECINITARERRRRKRDAVLSTLGKRLRAGTPASKTEAVVAATIRRLGGVEAFGKATAELVQKSKGRRESLSAFRLMWQMILAASERQRNEMCSTS